MTLPSNGKFAEWAQAFLDSLPACGQRPSEIESKTSIVRRHLTPAFGELRLGEISLRIEAYQQQCRRHGLSDKTVNNHLSVLRRVLAWARTNGASFRVDRIAGLRVRAAPGETLDIEQTRRLVECADDDFRAMPLLAAHAGLRLGELLALRWEDVDLEQGVVRVERAIVRGVVLPHGARLRRTLPLTASAQRALRAHPRRGAWLFSDDGERPWTPGACKWPLYRAARRAGLGRISWRTLAATFARELERRGAPHHAVHALLGTRARSASERARVSDLQALARVVGLLEVKDRRSRVEWRPSRLAVGSVTSVATRAGIAGAAGDAASSLAAERRAVLGAVLRAAVVRRAVDAATRGQAERQEQRRAEPNGERSAHRRARFQNRASSSAPNAFGLA